MIEKELQPASYPMPVVRKEWLDLVKEEIIEPALPIIDPHHHLWHDRPTGRYLLDELYADLNAGHNVIATMFVQCGWLNKSNDPIETRSIRETKAVAAAAVLGETGAYGKARACAGLIAHVDLRLDALDSVLDLHQQAGEKYLRGIRHNPTWHQAILIPTAMPTPPDLLLDPSFLRGVRRLGQRGLTFECWPYHTQLDELFSMVSQAPETTIIINHVGGPLGCGPYKGKGEEVFATWSAGMKKLATCSNVNVKLGGLGMPVNGFDYHLRSTPPSSSQVASDWKPWIETSIELFGAQRCMFESNFPVDKAMVSYPVLWNAFKRIAANTSTVEKSALFHDTAARVYRL